MQDFSIFPPRMLVGLWRDRNLIRALVHREVVGRYRGSVLGVFWSFFNPILMLLIYTFVFSVVFKMRWNVGSDSKTEFAMVLFPGLIVFTLFSECLNRAPSLIVSNANYVKKVVFPLEILPCVALGATVFHAAVSLSVWLIAHLFLFGVPHPSALLIPLILLPLLLFTMGVSWFLASLGVYLRDVAQFMGMITTILMFLSPIFYPVNAFPEKYRNLLFLNPVTPAIEQARDVLFWGRVPDLWVFLVYLLGGAFVAWCGFAWFQKTRRGFADVL
ncbi:ABC transporter permease [Bradyrhizobium sp. 30]|uniref:ABC transporter permease n=1 Tax=Bradyrhizobium sp. 30 TaxID=2782669 RepID=UPI001FF7D33A|nr:ABC transporter permease [Bradyrhizobium sp. 30]MCK1291975.1 ABC transporter permease [Bradyrhizobium sp. 30]